MPTTTLPLTVTDFEAALSAIQEKKARLQKLAKTLATRGTPGDRATKEAAIEEAQEEARFLDQAELRFAAAIEAMR